MTSPTNDDMVFVSDENGPAVRPSFTSPKLDGMFDDEIDDELVLSSSYRSSIIGSTSTSNGPMTVGHPSENTNAINRSVSIGPRSTANINNLPASIDDEYPEDGIITTVDLSLIHNAAANALKALVAKEQDKEVEVTEQNCVRLLECAAQPYAWGKIGSSALVARMKASQSADFVIQEEQPYAELWLGTHPNGMSNIVLSDGTVSPLLDYVRSSPEMHLGVEGATAPSDDYDITFLFKVLSIHKVLSIQSHPDKHLAAQLHTDFPKIYKDPNHKPEMAVALTDDFEAMSGFRPITEIADHLQEYPEFASLLHKDAKQSLLESANRRHLFPLRRKVLQQLFQSYMEAKDEVVQEQLVVMLSRLEAKEYPNDVDELILRLAQQFPGDCGIFAPLLFNHLRLTKGEAFYIGANEPHAYIQGEILECMACSDNVVRAGLTPKLKDVPTLVKMLTYKSTLPDITRGKALDECTTLYAPPVEDFAMELIHVKPGETYVLNNVRSPCLLLTLEGSATLEQGDVQALPVDFGKAAFMSANTRATVVASVVTGVVIVRALANVHVQKEKI